MVFVERLFEFADDGCVRRIRRQIHLLLWIALIVVKLRSLFATVPLGVSITLCADTVARKSSPLDLRERGLIPSRRWIVEQRFQTSAIEVFGWFESR